MPDDTFDDLAARLPELAAMYRQYDRSWDQTVATIADVERWGQRRRLVTRVTTAVREGDATIRFELGSSAIECREVPPAIAARAVELAGKAGVDLRVVGIEPNSSARWTLRVAAMCSTPVPFAVLDVPMRVLWVETAEV